MHKKNFGLYANSTRSLVLLSTPGLSISVLAISRVKIEEKKFKSGLFTKKKKKNGNFKI